MPVKSKAEEAYLAIHHPEVLHKWKREGVRTKTTGLPEHVKKHASVPDLLAAMEKDKETDKKVQKAISEDQKADAVVRERLREGESALKKKAEPDPDRDRQADDEGNVKDDDARRDDVEAENFYGHGAGVKGKRMNTVKDLLKKKASEGDDLAQSLEGVKENARKTMGNIKPPPGSVPAPKTVPPTPQTPGVPAEKKAEDAGADLARSIEGVKDNARKTMGDIKPTPAQTPPPKVKMGPPQNIKAASAFTNMPNRADAMFFTKAAGRKDGMFFKAANEIEGYGPGSVGDAMASNPATGAIGGGMGHGKGVKAAPKKAPAA